MASSNVINIPTYSHVSKKFKRYTTENKIEDTPKAPTKNIYVAITYDSALVILCLGLSPLLICLRLNPLFGIYITQFFFITIIIQHKIQKKSS